MDCEYIYPTRRGKITLAVFYVVVGCWYCANQYVLMPITKDISAMEFCDSLPWVKGEIVYAGIYGLLIAALMFWIGGRMLYFKQVPHPGAYVWSKTKVERGVRPVLNGGLAVISGGALVAALAWAAREFLAFELLVATKASVGCA